MPEPRHTGNGERDGNRGILLHAARASVPFPVPVPPDGHKTSQARVHPGNSGGDE